jgi:hypothetical protein
VYLPPENSLVSSGNTRFPSTSERGALARGAGEDEERLAPLNGRWAGPTDVARLATEADRVLTF